MPGPHHGCRKEAFDMPGNAELGQAIAGKATEPGTLTCAHSSVPSPGIEYGTLVPMRYMNPDNDVRVTSIAA